MTDRQSSPWYPTVVGTAVVAAVFSALVGIFLLVDVARRSATLPLDVPRFQALRARLAQEPDNDPLRTEVRELDLRLRAAYFRQRRFTERGGYLLAGGLTIALVAARLAATLRRQLPAPSGAPPREDPDLRMTRFARWAVAGLVVLLVAAASTLSVSYRSALPGRVDQLARRTEPGQAPTRAAQTPEVAPEAGWASPAAMLSNWPRFRGPHGAGVAAYTNIPTTWDGGSGTGIRWKTPVPLPGNNSPVVWGQRVFLSGATAERAEAYCFDTQSGKLVWQRSIAADRATAKVPPTVSEDTGYAAPTAATDGHRVFFIFANGDLAALDFSGQVLWTVPLGLPKNIYGHASSLATYRDLLIVQFDQGSARDGQSRLLALRAADGAIVWQAPRDVPNSWTSPIVIEHAGQPQIITCADPWVIAYAPADGTELWRAKCLRQDVGPSPVYANGIVYVASEFPCVSAIDAGGRGDVTESHVRWTADAGLPDTCGPLVAGPLVLLLASYGTLTCYDGAEGGEPLWETDFEDSFRSSPSLVGTRIYLFGESGKSWVVEPSRTQCQQVAQGDLGESCVTSPAFQDGRMYIRGAKHLFCISTP